MRRKQFRGKAVGVVERLVGRLLTRVFGTIASLVFAPSLVAMAEPAEQRIYSVSELKFGALYHDTPYLWSGFSVEQPAADANFEVLFAPWVETFGGVVRPAIGATFNFKGDTSKAYVDLRWESASASGLFVAFGLGAAIHNGELNLVDPSRKALGSRVLFHPSTELGYRFDDVHSLSIFLDHMSNGFTARYNEGMDTVGIRYGLALRPVELREQLDRYVGDFSGFYMGVLGGYQHESADWFTAPPVGSVRGRFEWGSYVGYNWQSEGGIFGFEAEVLPEKRGFRTGCGAPGIACQMELSSIYSVRTRFGWAFHDVLIYGTGGVTLAPWDEAVIDLATSKKLDHTSGFNFGVAVGAGIEYKPIEWIGIRAEFMHYGIPGSGLGIPVAGKTADQFQSYAGRLGISWYFH